MKIGGAFNQALLGIQRGISGAQENASKLASAETFSSGNPADIVEPIVGLRANELQVQASAKVLETVDDMLGSLFDEKA